MCARSTRQGPKETTNTRAKSKATLMCDTIKKFVGQVREKVQKRAIDPTVAEALQKTRQEAEEGLSGQEWARDRYSKEQKKADS